MVTVCCVVLRLPHHLGSLWAPAILRMPCVKLSVARPAASSSRCAFQGTAPKRDG